MIKKHLPIVFFLSFIFITPLFFSSCSTTKHIKYFEDIPDSGQVKTLKQADYVEPKIQVDDIMTIIIQTVDPTATLAINAGNVSTTSAGVSTSAPGAIQSATSVSGYLVGKKGDIELPVLGSLHLEGLTTSEAKNSSGQKHYNFLRSHL